MYLGTISRIIHVSVGRVSKLEFFNLMKFPYIDQMQNILDVMSQYFLGSMSTYN